MGCATAWTLAADGHDVDLYERFEAGHEHGSSHGRTRIVRLAYPDPYWVRLAGEAMAGWRALEAESGERLLELSGLVEFAPPGVDSAPALTAAGAEFTRPTADEVRRRWGLRVPGGCDTLFQPLAGAVRADLALRAFLDGALRRGVRLHEHSPVASPDAVDADAVVVTAGSWVRTLVPDVPVRVTTETVVYFDRGGPVPPSVVELSTRIALYSLWDPVHGLKVGVHHAGVPTDPLAPAPPPDRAIVERAAAWVAAVHATADPRPVAAQTCRYTTTADEAFVLERRGRVVVGSACSGHGFKFAPAVGRRLAGLATGQDPVR